MGAPGSGRVQGSSQQAAHLFPILIQRTGETTPFPHLGRPHTGAEQIGGKYRIPEVYSFRV